MVGGITKRKLIPLGAFEPKMHVMFPGEADAVVHLHGAIGRACRYIRQIGFGKYGALCTPGLFRSKTAIFITVRYMTNCCPYLICTKPEVMTSVHFSM